MGWYLGHQVLLQHPHSPSPTFLFFCTFFKIYHVSLKKKRKNISFSRVYVCVKAKLTLVSFFSFYFLHLPLMQLSEIYSSFHYGAKLSSLGYLPGLMELAQVCSYLVQDGYTITCQRGMQHCGWYWISAQYRASHSAN